jgi:hypothetical protein
MLIYNTRDNPWECWLLTNDWSELTNADNYIYVSTGGRTRSVREQNSYIFRVLISCIKFLAKCMCPRCLSVKSKITEVGSKMDMRNRVKHARNDNDACRFDIETVMMLFEKGINITSVKIDRILGPTSAVPT